MALFLGTRTLLAPHDPETDLLNVVALTPRAVDAEVGGLGAPAYNRLIEEQNAMAAEKASADGQSFVPTPVGQTTPPTTPQITPRITKLSIPETPPKEPTPAPTNQNPIPLHMPPPPRAPAPIVHPVSTKPPEPAPVDLEFQKALLADLKNFLSVSKARFSGPVLTYPATKPPESQPSVLATTGPTTLKPGDLLLAMTDLALNSDQPSPVVATVTYGPFKGAKFLGKFERGPHGANLTFNRLVPLGQNPKTVEALAVDPQTGLTAVASSVDTHFLSRWGGLLASGFLEGFGAALSNRGSRVYANGDILIEDRPEKTVKDASLEALGQVGRYAGEQFRADFNRPPTIRVNAGQPLAILILSVQN
jgi:hypothetical protein